MMMALDVAKVEAIAAVEIKNKERRKQMKYVYGPVPSRRLGASLGISVTPKKACNYSCIYCQLGKTNLMMNDRQNFFKTSDIIDELEKVLVKQENFDVVTIAGDGEPTLFLDLENLILEIKKRVKVPVAVITNGGLLYLEEVQKALLNADIVLPTIDAYDLESYKHINRHHKGLSFEKMFQGLVDFSKRYKGQIWLEMMIMEGVNDSFEQLSKFKEMLKKVKYTKLYINTPVRPPQMSEAKVLTYDDMLRVAKELNAISLDVMSNEKFYSIIEDDYEAILNTTQRHPMNKFEVDSFLSSRGVTNKEEIFARLANDPKIKIINYKGIDTYNVK